MQVKKICMIGAFGVGKTSLVNRFVRETFSEKYLTTVGVKIDTKLVVMNNGETVKLILWDIAGTEALSSVEMRYLKGANGYLLVADCTRADTLEIALDLDEKAQSLLQTPPRVLLVNKADLIDQWEIDKARINELASSQLPVLLTSALSGEGVEHAFRELATRICKGRL